MKTLKLDLPSTIEKLELQLFADEHIGDRMCDLKRLQNRIDYVKNNENVYCILNGDILDFATKLSIGDVESRTYNIMGQLEKATELFTPIKDKILCITNGNHENRAYTKEGIDMSKVIAGQLGLIDRYSQGGIYMFLRFGNSNKNQKILYKIYAIHGSGGGRKEGAKAIRLADMASICDADVYIHSHTHLPMIMKQDFFRPYDQKSSIHQETRLFVNTASNLNYGGYGEVAEFKPNSKDTPTIFLDGRIKKSIAKL